MFLPARLFIILLFLPIFSQASLQIPKNLAEGDRRRVTEILGYSSSMKVLGNPYPLGGYSGVEVGYAYEVIATKEISNLGGSSNSDSETNYSLVTISKGIYSNIDTMIQFSPFSQAEGVSNVGGQLRWGFFQADHLPLHMSLMSSMNSVNYQDKVTMLSQGNDVVAGFSVRDITLYLGAGTIRTVSTFSGGKTCSGPNNCTKNADSITDSGDTAKEDISDSHYLAGVNIRMDKAFLAMQMDRYTQSVFSAKLGIRF